MVIELFEYHMSPDSKRPDIERIIGRYLDAWEIFEDEIFTCDELETELLRKRDPEDVPSSDKINNDLYRVAYLGLVDWYGEEEYQVAISPESKEESWSELIQSHASWVRNSVKEELKEREEEEETEVEEADEPEVLEYENQRYMSAFVGPNSDLNGQARYYQAALSPNRHDGVVLRSYQGVANSTTKLAEEICDDEKMSETDCIYRFEIADEKMIEAEDDLEYQVFLKEKRLL